MRRLVPKNIPLLIISWLLAVTLWISVQAQSMQISTKDISVPLNYDNLDPKLVIVKIPADVMISVEGPAEKLGDPGLKNAQAIVDLRGATPGLHTYNAIIEAPDRDVSRMLPRDTSRVSIDIENKETKSFNVDVEPSGRITDRTVTYGGAQVDPPSVEFSGSRTNLSQIAKVRVRLDLNNVDPNNADRTFSLHVDAVDAAGHSLLYSKVQPTVAEVKVRPTIDPATVDKDLFIVPIVVGRPAVGYQVISYKAVPEKLGVTGASLLLAESSSIETYPIDVTGLKGTVELRARLRMSPGLTIMQKTPVSVLVEIVPEQLPRGDAIPPRRTVDPYPEKVPPLTSPRGGAH